MIRPYIVKNSPKIFPKPENRIAVKLSANVVAAFKEKGQNRQHKDTVSGGGC